MQVDDELVEVLREVAPGADVWSYRAAKWCRDLERMGLVRIVKARGAPKDGAKQQPYFGAIATAKGRKFLAGLKP